jgi:LysM repeat protein
VSALGRWPIVLVLAGGLVGVGTAAAGERVHIVAAGESAASVAKKYYGEPKLGEMLLRYNDKAGTVLQPGERLTIPYSEVYRARPGDTWSVLAKRRLGRASASPVLAELNGYAAGQALPAGARIAFPVVLHHSLVRGESLSSLADRYYGDAKKAATIQAFSRTVEATRLAAGTPLEIPLIVSLRGEADSIRTEPKDKAAVAVPPPPPARPPEKATAAPASEAAIPLPPADERRFETPLAEAERHFADGEYDDAKQVLEALREPVTSRGGVSDRRAWGQLMAFVYIALDRNDDACAAYRAGSPPAEPASFDPDLISPLIRSVLSNCPSVTSVPGQLDNPGPPPQIPLHANTRG